MKTVELFAGTKSFSKVAAELGHDTFTTDIEVIDGQDLVADVFDLTCRELPFKPDILWASPPCEGFSVGSIGKHWHHDHTPKTAKAEEAVKLVQQATRLIEEVKPKWWFIENPRGKLRKLNLMPEDAIRHTITYCQYGDDRMKPTDIWTNAFWWKPRAMCKNGMTCHTAAPRGSRTGTQGRGTYKDKSRIPPDLFHEIFEHHGRQ